MQLNNVHIVLLFFGILFGSILIANGIHNDNLLVGIIGSIILSFSCGTLTVIGLHDEEKRW